MSTAQKVIVGLSGGVDSSVSALLLKEAGYDVAGVFMQNWSHEQDDPHCTADADLSDARAICDTLNIPLSTVNFSEDYWDRVFAYCLDEYAKGRTPNPDIWCNREIKFQVFLHYALEQGAAFLATGHYAQIRKTHNEYQLLRGLDTNKDQTYFLYTLNQQQLAHSLFPVGALKKPLVRKKAEEHRLITHNKKDSTGICFVGERKFKAFLSQFILAKPGNMETPEGKIVGKHDGVMFYTLGQRKGLQIGGLKAFDEAPWYVVGKDVKRNVLIVAQGHDHPLLFHRALIAEEMHWISGNTMNFPKKCTAKIRYRSKDEPCTVYRDGSVVFDQPQWAITPGQSIVFYDDEVCLGGAVIAQPIEK